MTGALPPKCLQSLGQDVSARPPGLASSLLTRNPCCQRPPEDPGRCHGAEAFWGQPTAWHRWGPSRPASGTSVPPHPTGTDAWDTLRPLFLAEGAQAAGRGVGAPLGGGPSVAGHLLSPPVEGVAGLHKRDYSGQRRPPTEEATCRLCPQDAETQGGMDASDQHDHTQPRLLRSQSSHAGDSEELGTAGPRGRCSARLPPPPWPGGAVGQSVTLNRQGRGHPVRAQTRGSQ